MLQVNKKSVLQKKLGPFSRHLYSRDASSQVMHGYTYIRADKILFAYTMCVTIFFLKEVTLS